MTVAEAINRACDEAEKFDEACRIARQQEEAINELCTWIDELKAYRETGLTPEEVAALAGEVNIWKSGYYDLLKTTEWGISMLRETVEKIYGVNKPESEG